VFLAGFTTCDLYGQKSFRRSDQCMFVLLQRGQFFRVATRGDISVLIPEDLENDKTLELSFAGGKVTTWLTMQEFMELVWEIRSEISRQHWDGEKQNQ